MKNRRVFLKLSGEALAGPKKTGFDEDTVKEVARQVKASVDAGVQVAIVVGGGNFWRGRSSGKMDRTRADHMGMLATTINALGVGDTLEQEGVDVRVMTAISMPQVATPINGHAPPKKLAWDIFFFSPNTMTASACGTPLPQTKK